MNPSEFSGKTALITGVASGFGLATAQMLAAGGASIVGVDRNAVGLSAGLAKLPVIVAAKHHAIVQDLLEPEAARSIVTRAMQLAGPIDILVNSAGVCHFRRTGEITTREWDEVVNLDLRAIYFLSVAVAEQVDAKRGCRIINLGSNAGRKGRAFSAHYAAAKAAVVNVTESLAVAYGPRGVTVNTVCPAVVLTPLWNESFDELGAIAGKSADELVAGWTALTPLRRLGAVEDVANLITFLASSRAAFITGQQINVCGGFMLTC